MLKRLKVAFLRRMQGARVLALFAGSRWRARRLLIICYHGVSLDDEHEWNPLLYVSPATFRRRLTLLRSGSYNVLPLREALRGLVEGTLPDRAVTLTFDDGHHDFYRVTYPMLREFGYPATVYLTTYHVDCNVPIFALICSYMLWKSRVTEVDLGPLIGAGRLRLGSVANRAAAQTALVDFAQCNQLSAMDKHNLAESLARVLGVDFDNLCARRILHLLNAAEVSELAAAGVDFQLHTHCHRSPRVELEYREQVRRNRQRVEQLTRRPATHFCYPSGETAPEFPAWLAAEGVETAVTCIPGLAERTMNPFLLPRLLDHSGLSEAEFVGWLSGLSHFLPARTGD